MSQPLRVGFLTPNLERGGLQNAIRLICKHGPDHGLDPVVIPLHRTAAGGFEDAIVAGGTKVHHLDLDGRADRSPAVLREAVRRLGALIDAEDLAILDSSMFEADLVGRLACRTRSTLHVTHLVNLRYDQRAYDALPPRSRARLRILQEIDRRTLRWSAGVVALTEGIADSLGPPLGLTRNEIAVVPRGVARDEYPARPPRAHWDERHASDPIRLVSLGRLAPEKGHAALLDGIANIHTDRPIELRLYGSGPLRQELIARAAEISRPGLSVSVEDPVTSPLGVLEQADGFCFPSIIEGQGNALLEAMAVGVPVLASDIATLREVAGSSAVFFDVLRPVSVGAAIEQFAASSAADVEAAIAVGQQRVTERFDAQACIGQLAQWLRQIAGDAA